MEDKGRRDYSLAAISSLGWRRRVAAPFRRARNIACRTGVVRRYNECASTLAVQRTTAGRPALHGGEPGQVRKEAAIADLRKCRGYGSPPFFAHQIDLILCCSPARASSQADLIANRPT